MEKNSPYKPAFGFPQWHMQFWKSCFLTLSCHLLEIFQNKHAAIIHGKNAPRFVQYTASTTDYGDPIVLDIKKKKCVSVHMQCVCAQTHILLVTE